MHGGRKDKRPTDQSGLAQTPTGLRRLLPLLISPGRETDPRETSATTQDGVQDRVHVLLQVLFLGRKVDARAHRVDAHLLLVCARTTNPSAATSSKCASTRLVRTTNPSAATQPTQGASTDAVAAQGRTGHKSRLGCASPGVVLSHAVTAAQPCHRVPEFQAGPHGARPTKTEQLAMYGSTFLVPRVPSGACRIVAGLNGLVPRAPPDPSLPSCSLSSASGSSSSMSSCMSATYTQSCSCTVSEEW